MGFFNYIGRHCLNIKNILCNTTIYSLYNIYNLINIIRLSGHIGLFYVHKRYTRTYSRYILNNIIYNININGYIFIKFTQWLTSRLLILCNNDEDRQILTILEDIYENCHSHSIHETINMYKTDFNQNIFNDYKLCEMVGSGSIGQVYKGIDLNTKEIVAIKVKHYGIEYKYLISYFIIKIIIFIFWLFPCINYRVLPMKLNDFLDQLNSQLDFNNEVHNCNIMYENFKDNDTVIVPKVLKHSNNIIVMTYEGGEDFDKLKITEKKKLKIALYFTLLIYKMSYSFGFLHGDLHKGNWKIQYSYDTGYFKIIYYDFGYMLNINNINMNKSLIESMRYNLTKNITHILLNNCIPISASENRYNEIYTIITNHIKPSTTITTHKFTKLALLISTKYRLLYNTELINILLMLIQIEELCISNNIRQNDSLSYEDSINFQYKLNEEYIILCQTYKHYDDLLEYFTNLNNKYGLKKEVNNSMFSNISYLENLS